jgi:hypothetical protein
MPAPPELKSEGGSGGGGGYIFFFKDKLIVFNDTIVKPIAGPRAPAVKPGRVT